MRPWGKALQGHYRKHPWAVPRWCSASSRRDQATVQMPRTKGRSGDVLGRRDSILREGTSEPDLEWRRGGSRWEEKELQAKGMAGPETPECAGQVQAR